MATQNKTQPTDMNVNTFVQQISDERRKIDIEFLVKMVAMITNESPILWGESIIGFGKFTYHYSTGRSGEWMKVGIASRKQAITLYLSFDIAKYQTILNRLGKHTTGKGCLYIRSLSDVDLDVLEELISQSYKEGY